jgi:hypothetical protein
MRIFIAALLPALFFTASALRAAEPDETAAKLSGQAAAAPDLLHSTAAAAEAQISTAAPAAPALSPGQTGTLLTALRHISALLSKGALLDPKEFNRMLAEIAALDTRVTTLLGPVMISELEERDKEQRAKTELLRLRSLLIAYYGDTEGVYPATPQELVPKYLTSLPEVELSSHVITNFIELNADPGSDTKKAVTDAGGWLYFNNPASANFGMLILNCSHRDGRGNEFSDY